MKIPALLLMILSLATAVFSQTAAWNVLKTENGELAVKMPADCDEQLYMPQGITLRDRTRGRNYRLKEMRTVSCYREKTLLSVDVFETDSPHNALRILKDRHQYNSRDLNLEKPFDGIEFTNQSRDYVLMRRLIAGRNHLYIVTTAARGEANETMNRFLDSLKLTAEPSGESNGSDEPTRLISSLKNVGPEFVDLGDESENTALANLTPPFVREKTDKKLIVLHKTPALYTDEARKRKVSGKVVLRLDFGTNGSVTKIQVVRGLPDGLVREAVLASMQMKFLPEEEVDRPRPVSRLIEYNFNIY